MPKVDVASYRVLSLLRDRPLSLNDLAPLLDEEPAAAKEAVMKLFNDGLVARLAGTLRARVIPSGNERSSDLDDDEPLTLTFRGMMHL